MAKSSKYESDGLRYLEQNQEAIILTAQKTFLRHLRCVYFIRRKSKFFSEVEFVGCQRVEFWMVILVGFACSSISTFISVSVRWMVRFKASKRRFLSSLLALNMLSRVYVFVFPLKSISISLVPDGSLNSAML